MDRRAILERLRAEAPALRGNYRIASLALFGSMAHGDDREGGDLDVLVRFEGPADFGRFMGPKLDLEDLLLRPVDLATPDMIRSAMRGGVEADLVRIDDPAGEAAGHTGTRRGSPDE